MEKQKAILGILNQCQKCPNADCFQLVTPIVSKAEIQVEAMGFRADHPASLLTILEHVDTVDTTSLVTGEVVELAVWEAKFETPRAESGRAFPTPRPTFQN